VIGGNLVLVKFLAFLAGAAFVTLLVFLLRDIRREDDFL